MTPFEVVQAIQSAGVGVVGLDSRRTVVVLRAVDDKDIDETAVIRFRCVSQRIEIFSESHEGKVMATAAVVVVDIHDGIYACIGDGDGGGGGGGISLSPRGTRRIFRFAGKRNGNVSPPFRQRPDRQRTAILLLFISNPARRHRHLRTGLPVLLQTETSRNGAAGQIITF